MNESIVTMINKYKNIDDLIAFLKVDIFNHKVAEINYALDWAGIDISLYKSKYEKCNALIAFLEKDYKNR